ncbi:MAG: beta-propeller fold lactonase family protein [Acidobacteria bacterium]|nr:beta-propeller fold lactonase family protein [Acidobacteriota bacterium]
MKTLSMILLAVAFFGAAVPFSACGQEVFVPATSDSALLILNKEEATLVMVDGETLEIIAKIPTGDFPHEVAVSADGKTAYVANYGNQTPNNSLSIIDLVGKTELKRIDLGALWRPHGIVEANGKIYFTSEMSRTVARFDPEKGAVDWVIGTGQSATHMLVFTPDKQKIYTANIASDTVSVIKPNGGASPQNIKQIAVGKQPEAIDVSPDGKELWVGQNGDGKISIIDTATDKILEDITVGRVPIRLKFTPDGTKVLVSDASAGELVVVDAKTRKEIKRVTVGGTPVGIQLQPDGKRAFVALTQLDTVKVFDLEKMEFIKDIKPGKNPDGMGWAKYR